MASFAMDPRAGMTPDRQRQEMGGDQTRFAAVFHSSPVAIAIIDVAAGARLLDVNDAWVATSGYSREDAIGRSAAELGIITEEQSQKLHSLFRQQGRIRNAEYSFRRKDGSSGTGLLSAEPWHFDGMDGAIVTTVDITERKALERDLASSEARFRTLIEDAPVAISMSRDGKVIYGNPKYLQMFGLRDHAELLGRPTIEMFAPESRADVAERAARRARGLLVPEYESLGLRGDGTVFPMLVAVINMQFAEGPALVGFITDLTAPHLAEQERQKLQVQLVQSQKMESIGRLAGGLAHDFNNLLTVINGYSGLMLRQLNDGNPLSKLAQAIQRAGERGTELTGQLLAFSRKRTVEPETVDFNAVISDSRDMLQRLLGGDVVVITQLEPALRPIMANPGSLHQILMNLAANSRDAMPQGGIFSIETGNVDLSDDKTSALYNLPPGSYVRLTIADTGIGMDAEVQQHIFEPFFTTKPEGEGTGFGLSSVYGIVRQANGSISVSSEPGRGTTFVIHWPRISAGQIAPAPVSAVPVAEPAPASKQTVLIADDEPAIRDYFAEVLTGAGYGVLLAADGKEAVQLARSNAIQAALIDLIMPEQEGIETTQMLRREWPDLKIVAVSGGFGARYLDIARKLGADSVLDKPVGPQLLLATIAKVLQGSATGR